MKLLERLKEKHRKNNKKSVDLPTVEAESKESGYTVNNPHNDINPVAVTIPKKEAKKVPSKHDTLVAEEKKRLANCVYDLVVIDFETTGLKSPLDTCIKGVKYDEILSVSIIDQDENVLLNTLCKPKMRKTWTKAQEINGISPAMVKDKQPFEDIFPTVKEILLKSKLVIAYNIDFERGFLLGYDAICDFVGGCKLREKIVWGADPMFMYSGYICNEKWQKLSTVARHFKYKFEAHDSLEDVKATLFCYKKMIEFINANEDKKYIYKYGFLYDVGVGRKGEWLDMNTYNIKDESLIKE